MRLSRCSKRPDESNASFSEDRDRLCTRAGEQIRHQVRSRQPESPVFLPGACLSTPDRYVNSLNEVSERKDRVLPLSRQFVDRLKDFSKLGLRFALAHAGTETKFLGLGLPIFPPLGIPILFPVSDSNF